MNKVLLLILGMMLVTYFPRLFPFILMSKRDFPKYINKFLLFIPPTALGALIIPGVFSAIPHKPAASIAGIAFACIYSWRRGGIIIPVLGSIATVFCILLVY